MSDFIEKPSDKLTSSERKVRYFLSSVFLSWGVSYP